MENTLLEINTDTTGFESPAKDYVTKRLDLNDLITYDPITTYYFRYSGNEKLGVKNNDILIVDKSINPETGDLVLIKKDKILLQEFNNQENIWGTIIWVLSQKKKQ